MMLRRRLSRWSRFLGIFGLCVVAFGSLYVKNSDKTIMSGNDPLVVVQEYSENKNPAENNAPVNNAPVNNPPANNALSSEEEKMKGLASILNFVINPYPGNHDIQAFANSLEPEQTPSNSASEQVPSCLPLSKYVLQIMLAEEMKTRTDRVQRICQFMKDRNITLPNSKSFETEYVRHMLIVEKTQTVWCYLPKVASTNFRRTLLGLMGIIPKSEVPTIGGYEVYNVHDKEFKYIRDFDEEKQKEMMGTYNKFFATRDPIERLLSGYMSKFLHPNPVNRHEFNKRVSLFYGSHPELDQIHKMKIDYESRSVFFEEFLVWWSDLYDEGLYVNEHFVPSHVLCNPCDVKYNYIGKYEHINRDMDFIFKSLNLDAEFPGRNDNYSTRRTHTMVEEVYKPLPAWLLQKIWDIMKWDFVIFDYPIPDWIKNNVDLGIMPDF